MFRQMHLALVCAALSLPACIAETGEEEPAAASDDAVTAASLKPAVKKAFEKQLTMTDISQLPSIERANLPTSVGKAYDKLTKEWGDYPPYAVKMKAGSTTVILLAEDTDGGSYWEFYTTKGTHITGASQSESGDLHWNN